METSQKSRRILVVDDEPSMLDFCSRALSRAKKGYDVTLSSSAEDARAQLARCEFDLLILDIHLPQEDGISLLKHAQATHPGLPVILITGYPAVNTVVDAIRLNVREYLCKPFSVARFLEVVEENVT